MFQDPWIRRDGAFLVRSFYDNSLHDMRVSELMKNGVRCWDEELVEKLFEAEEAKEILRIPLNSARDDDSIVWHYSSKGSYTVKSCYELARERSLDTEFAVEGCWSKIWSLVVPSKVKFFLWRAAHEVLPTKANLISRGVEVGVECGICGRGYENTRHVLLDCEFAKKCWQESRFGNTMQPLVERFDSFSQILLVIISINDMDTKSGIGMLMWQIWKDKNDKL